jgi:hypothetical protein
VTRRFTVVLPLLVALVGCASAGGDEAPNDGDEVPDAAPNLADVSLPPLPDAAPGAADAAPGAPDAAPQPDAAIPGGGCESAQTCGMATLLANISGDRGADKVTRTGHQSAWFSLRVTEDNHDAFTAARMRVTVKLTSPAEADYAVFVYMDPNSDTPECLDVFGTPSNSGKVRTVTATWGESGLVANGAEDGRDVAIEVKPISTVCRPEQSWTLEISGN